MTLDDLKEQLLERLKEYGNKIAENESVIQLTEKYKNLSPLMQKALAGFAIFLTIYLIYAVPAGFVDSSKELEASFTTNRNLIRGLFRNARNPAVSAERFKGQDFGQMKGRIDGLLTNNQVLDSQKGTFSPANKPLPARQVPTSIQQAGMSFELKKLNLKQVVNISEQISIMHPNTKLAAVEIRADKDDPHYFNVKYTVSSLTLPMKADKPETPAKKR